MRLASASASARCACASRNSPLRARLAVSKSVGSSWSRVSPAATKPPGTKSDLDRSRCRPRAVAGGPRAPPRPCHDDDLGEKSPRCPRHDLHRRWRTPRAAHTLGGRLRRVDPAGARAVVSAGRAASEPPDLARRVTVYSPPRPVAISGQRPVKADARLEQQPLGRRGCCRRRSCSFVSAATTSM